MAITAPFFADAEFQDQLVVLLCTDPKTLADCGGLLRPADFEPVQGVPDGRPRWIVATRALEYWQEYRQPIRNLVRSDVLHYAEQMNFGERQQKELRAYLEKIRSKQPQNPDAIVGKILPYKLQRIRADLLTQMAELHAAGRLTDEAWGEMAEKGRSIQQRPTAVNYYSDESLRSRIARRLATRTAAPTPCFLIDPLDQLVKGIDCGQIGLVMAPTKRGKSLFLIWISAAYTIQGLNVLHITLEDPKSDVEDRFDAALSGVPFHELTVNAAFERRWRRGKRYARAELRIVDGTETAYSVADVEQEYLRYRSDGFIADAVVIDYDDELRPARKRESRHEEFNQIYQDLRRLASRYKLLLWTAAQTQRGTENIKILSHSRVADAMGKIRKSSMALSLGKSDWGDDAMFIWVAAHKFDTQEIGCDIAGDRSRMMIYDREVTMRKRAEHGTETDLEY